MLSTHSVIFVISVQRDAFIVDLLYLKSTKSYLCNLSNLDFSILKQNIGFINYELDVKVQKLLPGHKCCFYLNIFLIPML